MKTLYAEAITRLLAKGIDEALLVKNLVAHLKSVGRMKLLPGIRSELKVLQVRNTVHEAHIEVARKEDTKSAQEAAAKEGITASVVTVNPSLIRGWRARSGGTLLDRSGKRALIDLYDRITAS